jgi:UDP:flavonoid glycosyltransferase YjiC (YdhE family)
MQRFFSTSVEAAQRLGVRAMLVTNFAAQLPRDVPKDVQAFGYLPFSEVLPRAALLVHHGGIGTLAQTIKAGIPHLVVPCAHDQFDNGWRIEQLGVGRSIPQTRYRVSSAANAIRTILSDGPMKARAREYAAKVDSASALTQACNLIEDLGRRGDDTDFAIQSYFA